MIKKKGKPITGTNTAMRPKAPVLTNSSKSSAQAQQQIMQPPQPFANPKGPVNLPVTKRLETTSADLTKSIQGMKHKNIGHMALPNQKHAGQTKAINHSGNVFGRFGTKHPKKSRPNDNPKAKKHAAFYGM